MNINEILKLLMHGTGFVLCSDFYDYLFSDNFGEEGGTWNVYNTYFKTEDVERIVITSSGAEIVLK